LNSLPSSVVTASTFISFDGRLDKFLESQPRKYKYNQAIVINMTGHNKIMNSSDKELTEDTFYRDLQSEQDRQGADRRYLL
jgi:hypothetical protein